MYIVLYTREFFVIRDRILKLFELSGLSPSEFEERTGISKHTWGNLKAGRQRANEDQISAVCKAFPEYAYWVATGEVLPIAGQISPELETTRQNLQTGT